MQGKTSSALRCTTALPAQYAGVYLRRGGAAAVYSLDHNAPAGAPVRLADGFSPAEKFRTLSGATGTLTKAVLVR